MASRADILDQLKQAVAAIERGDSLSASSPEAELPASPSPSRAPAPSSVGESPFAAAPTPGSCDEEPTAQEAYQKILRLISIRERSSAYLRSRLLKEEYPVASVEEALAKCQRLHLVDDRRYADALIRMRLAAGKGLREAEREIEELGIDPSTLDAWQEYSARGREAEVQRALALLRRRPPRAKQAREAAYRKLINQGYGSDIAASAARQWAEENAPS